MWEAYGHVILMAASDWPNWDKTPCEVRITTRLSLSAIMANPRKFSEKIALHNQKQAEETAAFEAILREVSATTRVGPARSHVVPNQLISAIYTRKMCILRALSDLDSCQISEKIPFLASSSYMCIIQPLVDCPWEAKTYL